MRRINAAYEELVGDIINADGTWQFDDTNHTDLPRGTGDLVEGQESYSFALDYLTIESIEILGTDGVYHKIKPLDPNDLGGLSPQEYFGVTSGNPRKGFPEYYDVLADSIFLYPAPTSTHVTLTAGIRVWFKRTIDLFTTADTTQSPGLPAPYHVLLAYMAAVPFCMTYKKDRVPLLEKKVMEMRKALIQFYGLREKDRRKQITFRMANHL